MDHDTGAHPESPERIRTIERLLEERDWMGYDVTEAPRATEEQLVGVHPPAQIAAVREHCEQGVPFDLDTPTSPGSWEAALRSVGAPCAMVEALLAGDAPTGFCGLRPPGHHAEADRAMGFCLLSNVAIAARFAIDTLGVERVLVLDWDVHHGNGTNAIFHSSPEVLFASIHQWPFYPGTGSLADAGSGPGEGFTINLPVPAGAGEEEFLGLVQHVVSPAAREFGPGLILISAGFDAHRDDPLADCVLDSSSFAQMAAEIGALADDLGVPVGAVLEGGYDTGALAESVAATMEVLATGGQARRAEPGALVAAAAQQVGRYWSAVSA